MTEPDPIRDVAGNSDSPAPGPPRAASEKEALRLSNLLENEEKYRAVVEHSSDCILLFDLQSLLVLDANRAARRLLGYSTPEIVQCTLPQLLARTLEQVHDIVWRVTEGRRNFLGEIPFLTQDGRPVDLEVSASAIRHGGRDVLSLVGRDMSERKRLHKERRTMALRMNQIQKMEAIGQLAGGVAHDFNNMLTVIKGYSDLALRTPGLDLELAEYLENVHAAADSAADLTNQLLLFSRQQSLQFAPVDLNDTIENMMRMVPRLIGENVRVRSALAPDLPRVRADRGTLEQVLLNFAVNARDAMPDGGTIKIATDRTDFTEGDRLRHPQSSPGRYVRLSFVDTGTGIPEDTFQRIFEPFFTTKDPGQGTGLGLSVVYGIVQEHGGWIEVSSKLERGTVFEVFLPVLDSAGTSEEDDESAPPELTGEGRKILLVEDNPAVRNLASRFLSGIGFLVREAAGVRDAEEAFEKEEPFDLLFSDIVLPDGDGFDLADSAASRFPNTRILLTSGYPGRKSQFESIRRAGYTFLKKPYDTRDLADRLREVFSLEGEGGTVRTRGTS